MKRFKRSVSPLFLLHLLAIRSSAEELTLRVNFGQPVCVTNEKFLSLTLDPSTLFHGNALSTNFERSVNLAKALTPAYVRLGGPRGTFWGSNSQQLRAEEEAKTSVLTESEWIAAHRWAKEAGLEVIACIAPEYTSQEEKDEDAANVVSFSDRMNFDANWQLGYECQTRCNLSATDLAEQLVNLRKVLNAYPRYSSSFVIGPDVVTYKTEEQRQYLRDYLSIAAPALSAITWHPDFGSATLDNEGVLIRHDTLEKDKEELFKVIGRFAKKRPLWIAESKPEECKGLYLGALVLARRLGNAAKSKVNVVMRQPADLTQPTPDYWVSLLHKTLVGREVFDAKIQTSDESYVYLYCQCTEASDRYERGSITIFGINLSPENVRVSLKGVKISTLHGYVLSPGFDSPNRMFAKSVLLNNEPLTLINDTVPDIKPAILHDPKGLILNLATGDIGFWVLPDLQIKSCMETREALGMQNPRSNVRVPRSPEEREQDAKGRVTRSVRNRETVRNEKRKEGNDSRATRKSNLRKELRRLRKFAKTKVDDYDARKSSNVEESLNSKAEDAAIRRMKSVNVQSKSEDDPQITLQAFKDRLFRMRDLDAKKGMAGGNSDELVAKTISLISKVQNALGAANRETDYANRVKLTNSAKDHLKLLYNFLTRTNFIELADDSGLERDELDHGEKRAERDLLGKMVESASHLAGENRLRERSRLEEIEKRRNGRREDASVQPSIVRMGTSEEQTFYGFFKTEPIKGFPDGDVLFDTDNSSPYSSSDGKKDEPDVPLYRDNPEHLHEYYEFDKSTNAPKTSNDRSTPELWEAETHGHRESNDGRSRLKHSRSARIKRSQTAKIKLINQGPNVLDSISKKVDPSTNDYVRETRRLKRKNLDLFAILDREMIKEDDANSKDCKCRVIRSKRQALEPLAYATVSDEATTASSNLEAFSELRDALPETLEPQTEPSNLKIERNAETALDNGYGDTSNLAPEDRSNLAENPENSKPSEPLEDSSSTLSTNSEDNSKSLLKTSIDREKSKFFRVRSAKKQETEIDNFEDPATYYSDGQESSTPLDSAYGAEDNGDAKEIEAPKAEASGATLESAAVSEEGIVEKPENNHDNDRAARGSLKRHVESEGASSEASPMAEDARTQSINGSRGDKRRTKSSQKTKPAVIVMKPWERRLLENARTLITLKRMIDERKRRKDEESGARSGLADRKWEYQRKRWDRAQKLKNRSNEKRQRQNQRSVSCFANESESEEKKNLKRRETWGATEPDDASINLDESEKLASILMYELSESDAQREERAADESMEKENAPAIEIVRTPNVRERLFNPESMRKFGDRAIVKSLDPSAIEEKIVRLRNLYDRGTTKPEESEEDTEGKDKSYFALVEDLENPRIFHYRQKSRDERKRSVQVYSPRSCSYSGEDSSPRRADSENFEIIENSNEEDGEESDELSVNREIYIIDPSSYRGGQPTLQLYRNPSKPYGSQRANPRSEHKTIWEPVLYRTYRILRMEQRKLKDAEIEHLPELQSSSKNLNAEELLRILINSLDSQSAEKFLKRLTGQDSASVDKQKFARFVSEEPKEEESRKDSDEAKKEDRNPDGIKPSEINDTREVAEGNVSYQDLSMERETSVEEDTAPKVQSALGSVASRDNLEANLNEEGARKVRNRRDTSDRTADRFEWPLSVRVREPPRKPKKAGQNNYLCLRENSEETSNEGPSKVFKIVREGRYYKATSVKDAPNPTPENTKEENNPIIELKNPRVKLSLDYRETSDSVEDLSGLERTRDDSESCCADEDASSSEERVNSKELLFSDRPEVLMVLPWMKRLGRFRRHATNRGRTRNTEKVAKTQPLELQHLEEVSTARIPEYIDDVEKSMARKNPVERYAKEENLSVNYVNGEVKPKKNGDRGLPAFIEGSIPKLRNVVVDGLEKAQNFTGSVERLIENIDERLHETPEIREQKDPGDLKESSSAQNVFHRAIMNVKKIFMLLGGITHILHE